MIQINFATPELTLLAPLKKRREKNAGFFKFPFFKGGLREIFFDSLKLLGEINSCSPL